jgi:hypothetical protein
MLLTYSFCNSHWCVSNPPGLGTVQYALRLSIICGYPSYSFVRSSTPITTSSKFDPANRRFNWGTPVPIHVCTTHLICLFYAHMCICSLGTSDDSGKPLAGGPLKLLLASQRSAIMAAPEPATPSKKRAHRDTPESKTRIDSIFRAFSDQYNLGLTIPPVIPGSPHKQRDRANPEWEIYWRFFVHYNQDNHSTILNLFRDRAIALCQRWVGKPRANWDVVPQVTGLPKAATPMERHHLKQLLINVLDENAPPRSSLGHKKKNSLSGLGLISPEKQYRQPLFESASKLPTPKRSSTDRHGERLFKRTKSITTETYEDPGLEGHNTVSGINLDSATKDPSNQSRNHFRGSNHNLHTASATSSRPIVASSADEVFSQPDLPLLATQSTNEAIIAQEKRKLPLQATLRSYSVTSNSSQGLSEAFSVHDNHQGSPHNVNAKQTVHNSIPVLSYSDNILEEEINLEQLGPLYPILPAIERQATEIAASRSSKLEERLQAVWRKFNSSSLWNSD